MIESALWVPLGHKNRVIFPRRWPFGSTNNTLQVGWGSSAKYGHDPHHFVLHLSLFFFWEFFTCTDRIAQIGRPIQIDVSNQPKIKVAHGIVAICYMGFYLAQRAFTSSSSWNLLALPYAVWLDHRPSQQPVDSRTHPSHKIEFCINRTATESLPYQILQKFLLFFIEY